MQRPAAVFGGRSVGRVASMDDFDADERAPLTGSKTFIDEPSEEAAPTAKPTQQPEIGQEPEGPAKHRPPIQGSAQQQDGLPGERPPQQDAHTPGEVDQRPPASDMPHDMAEVGELQPQVLEASMPRPRANPPEVSPQHPSTSYPPEQGPQSQNALDRPPVFPSAQGAPMTGGNTRLPGAQPLPQGVHQDTSTQGRPQHAAPVLNQPQLVPRTTAGHQFQQQQQPYQQMQQNYQLHEQQHQHQVQHHHPPATQHLPPPHPQPNLPHPPTSQPYSQQQPGQPGQPHQQQQQYYDQQQLQRQQHQRQQQHPNQQALHFPAQSPPQRTVKVTQPQYQPLLTTCPQCHSGVMHKQFSPLGILLGIFCFPCGLLCCLLMRENKCSSCGMTI
ncbi:proline-rich proteoglycan 2-like [Acanthaster planci]|uniref:Membrane protein BRI3 n=1 Tax=Acanthaster planci TaxID=133434 RepID=A0A8B7XXJ4_ACAPL|nr:proline-rich proteoglycan 2-like [Acanthaster planci]